jgi:putative oxygen-independent coproporphyrinogen III oxidase
VAPNAARWHNTRMSRIETIAALADSAGLGDPGFAVYVHWPFCLAKCPYCDFNSHVRASAPDEARFVSAFAREIAHRAALTPGRKVRSVFFGGGTPSLMAPKTVGAILDTIAKHWRMEPNAEITLEANPTSVEAGRFRGYQGAGVNRVSIGVQALNDADLRALGRKHSVAEAIAALETAKAIFPRLSFDLIYARVGQTEKAWREELERAMKLATEHVSLYQLTIEPDTIFERLWKAGKLAIPDDDLARDLFDATQEIAGKHGFPAYETSNHARPGAESRHNLVYWRYGDYVGVGPGAHGRIVSGARRRAQATEKHPEMWLGQVEIEGHGLIADDPLSPEEQSDEFLLMGLRLTEGVDVHRYEALSGRRLSLSQIQSLAADGFITESGGRIRVTPMGAPLLDTIVADLAA